MNVHEKRMVERLIYELNTTNRQFMTCLREVQPGLTNHDLRLCLYLKAGMTTKEMALLLAISPDSAKKAKHRLRKKLQMPSSLSFEECFEKYTSPVQAAV